MRKPSTLMAGKFGSRHYGTRPYLAEALQATGGEQPLVVYIGVASGDDEAFGSALASLLEAAGARRVVWPKLARKRPQTVTARTALADADFVFVGGGDVDAGMQRLHDAGLVSDLRAAAARGVTFAGMSAGAIMLGERWIRWPHADAGDDEAETYECLSLVSCSLDTHGENDHWRETQSFVAVRARELGSRARAYAVPSGGALLVAGDGTLRARGEPITVFAAAPNERAAIETTLEAER